METKTVKELRELAKQYGIVGRWEMNKHELIQAIMNYESNSDFNDDEITFESDCIIKEVDKIQSEGLQNVTRTTEEYIKDIKPGTLVAFKLDENKNVALSGKFVKFDNEKVVVETKRGSLFTLSKNMIVWVKTGLRWPRWVYSMFNKAIKEQGVEIDNAIS